MTTRKYFKLSANANVIYQNLWNASKAEYRGTFTTINSYIRKEQRSEIHGISFCFMKPEK